MATVVVAGALPPGGTDPLVAAGHRIVDEVVAEADRRCLAIKVRKKQATAEREEARRLAAAMRTATVHQLEMHPPQRDLFGAPLKDPEVFHYLAFVALTQTAAAISLANTADGLPLDEANLTAMRAVAELALHVLDNVS